MLRPARRPVAIVILLTLFLVASAIAAPLAVARQPTQTKAAGLDIDSLTIPQLQDLMDSRRLNSVVLTNFYLQRIRKLNPVLNAVITVNPNALAEARAADRARRQGDDRPLLGIPIIVKDNINTTGMATTAGSWSLDGSTPSDAELITNLKNAGAIILGKANLSEWANFRSDPSSSGWSGIGGQTNMPYVLDRNPCGSSSGSAVAVAASLAVAAVGTETDGSVVCPSGANAVVGIKPTLGLVSQEGIVPISADQDTAGPMARNVTDAAVLLAAMSGAEDDYLGSLQADALADKRIGLWRMGTYVFTDPETGEEVIVDEDVAEIMEANVVDALEALDATVEFVEVPIGPAFGPEFGALLCEFKADLPAYFDTYTEPGYPKTLQDVIDFNDANPDLEGPWNSAIFELAEATNGRDAVCAELRAEADAIATAALNGILDEFDAIVAPTNGPAWVTDPVGGDFAATDGFATFVGSSTPSAITGWANITVPAGFVDGHLPVGVSFIGGANAEAELIGYAYAFEQETQVRVPPSYLPTLP